MKMTGKIVLGVSMALLLSAILYAWSSRDRYEFHSGMNGTVVWRCNKRTGLVEYCTLGGAWEQVKEPISSQP